MDVTLLNIGGSTSVHKKTQTVPGDVLVAGTEFNISEVENELR